MYIKTTIIVFMMLMIPTFFTVQGAFFKIQDYEKNKYDNDEHNETGPYTLFICMYCEK